MEAKSMQLPRFQLKEPDETKEPKLYKHWTPIRAVKENWPNEGDAHLSYSQYRKRITRFVNKQIILSQLDSDSEAEREKEIEAKNVEENIFLYGDIIQRQELINEGLEEAMLQTKKLIDKAIFNEFLMVNDIKREDIYDYKLAHPIPITECNTGTHTCDETPATLEQMKERLNKTFPEIHLQEYLMDSGTIYIMDDSFEDDLELIEDLCRLFSQNIGPTLAVCVDGKQFYCHPLLLGMLSDFFNNRDFSHVLYLPGSRIQARAFVNIYRWMIEPIQSMSLRQLVELLRGAHFLAIDELCNQLWDFTHELLQDRNHIIPMYTVAQRGCITIDKLLSPYVGYVFLRYVGSTEFQKLEAHKVKRMLDADTLGVNSEIEVLYAGALWLQGNWPLRKRFTGDVISSVRFELMPFVFILSFMRARDGTPALNGIRRCPAVHKQVYDGLIAQRHNPCKLQGNTGKFPRDWIYDPSCPYHHGHSCDAWRYVSYKQFLLYIKWIQTLPGLQLENIKHYTDDDIVCC
ncbi:uncharacterized protein LOC26528146 [Drosophila mojavensis]|uniref:BACK domain-containing protein n=1 Tax=Drosophila mojavensis TaxID=7230 RepID=A0A0Q9WYW7_DROMO|nr:uncharacterized protein LOC26528146 [Drosophila mojavensis]KRF94217.1 uncharacterized protein Dmoj_GI26505 [Drosophila mojavensis]